MQALNPKVDHFISHGCGRCSLYDTPKCKVHTWTEPIEYLRDILLHSELTEDHKWGMPTYTVNGKNVIILAAFKDFCSLNFFKGSLLNDPAKLLSKAGENAEASRILKITNIQQILDNKTAIEALITNAIETEKAGLKVVPKKPEELNIPQELLDKFAGDAAYEQAFKSLTPGRQKGYILHFNEAKQAKTRIARIEKFYDKVLLGKGFFD
jgi:uncharacterized protein YdeI (YjbR/CyaY-like superfamily)